MQAEESMVRWVVGSIPDGRLIELFLVPASAPMGVRRNKCTCVWGGGGGGGRQCNPAFDA